jgi:bifunctional UDP-N-acetylglucosamine pyrophosphorylase / glucosamine-1-phosphate N-acetyltransferase
MMAICAVVPAAGKGSRLGASTPKLLVEILPGLTVWDIIEEKLSKFVDNIHVIMSPDGKRLLEQHIQLKEPSIPVSIGVQSSPLGMGDAIFSNVSYWEEFEDILIMWGDQAYVAKGTIQTSILQHSRSSSKQNCTIPVVSMKAPYVDYVFSEGQGLINVLQSREGEICREVGYADVGTFVMSTLELNNAWKQFVKGAPVGGYTSEVNFLPFLPWLSSKGWKVKQVVCLNQDETRGINNPDDLEFIRSKIKAKKINDGKIDSENWIMR